MVYKNKKERNGKEELYILMKELTSQELKLYLFLYTKEGVFPLSFTEIKEKIGMSDSSYRRAIKGLKEKGHLQMMRGGQNPLYSFY